MAAVLYALALVAVLAAPALLAFYPAGYDRMTPAHLAAFVVATALLAAFGRRRAHRGGRPARAGLVLGAVAGTAGAALSQWLMHTPPATQAFVADLAAHGVPPRAALIMHQLHLVTSAVLTALIAAVFYGAVGLVAAWWGSRFAPQAPRTGNDRREETDRRRLKAGPST
ncbi:MAG: hypothetical protein K6V97_07420 [Actinomycetia bacterium]|nr:hypothetical protein [Actinomycetes bacterium]